MKCAVEKKLFEKSPFDPRMHFIDIFFCFCSLLKFLFSHSLDCDGFSSKYHNIATIENQIDAKRTIELWVRERLLRMLVGDMVEEMQNYISLYILCAIQISDRIDMLFRWKCFLHAVPLCREFFSIKNILKRYWIW